MKNNFSNLINEVEKTKGIDKEEILKTLKESLVLAYQKSFNSKQNVEVEIEKDGEIKICVVKKIVDEIKDSDKEISLSEASLIDPESEIDGYIEFESRPEDLRRVAIKTIKEIVTQKLSKVEHEFLLNKFSIFIDNIVTGIVRGVNDDNIFVEIVLPQSDKITTVLALSDQMVVDDYKVGEHYKFYVRNVVNFKKGTNFLISRTSPRLVVRLLELEVPEIKNETIVIKDIAREPGKRTKISVISNSPNVDAVGSCIGERGERIKKVTEELRGEKIDIISYSEKIEEYVKNSIKPAQAISVTYDNIKNAYNVKVPNELLSLAIGKGGQNVRLATRLTGTRIDITS